MDLGLKNKMVVVTGASKGIGKGIAIGLAKEGCNLVICARGKELLKETAKEIQKYNVEILPLVIDITQKDSEQKLLDECLKKYEKVDILVNNAGGNKRNAFIDTPDEDWQEIFELNFNSHMRISKKFATEMKRQGNGSIIFISSIFGREAGGPGLSIYNSTKSAMISMAKIMALELAKDNVRVNCVAPGSIRFPGGSWDKRCISDPKGMEEFVKNNIPLGRFGTVDEVSNVVTFLASDKASLVTGTCINVDGGQSRSLI
jgi:3-oxoacyl-[acyl-carrier protein] reductase